MKIKLPLFGDRRDSIIRVPLGTNSVGEDQYYHIAIIRPNTEFPISQIPKGVNPRDLCMTKGLYKEIKAAYAEGNMFLVYNGGMQATIDAASFDTVTENGRDYVEFTCDNADNGHYDGQHSAAAAEDAIGDEDKDKNNAPFSMVLIDDGLFPDRESRRTAATRTNNRSAQEIKSEMNIRGAFNGIKKNISYCPEENIRFKGNQLNANGETMKPESTITQLINMLGSFLPLAMVPGGEIRDISGWPKKGESSLTRLENEAIVAELASTFEHVDFVLDMADFVRSTTAEVLGPKASMYGITKMSTAPQRKKEIVNRKSLKTQLFNGTTVKGGLYKDLLPLLLHAIIATVYEYDDASGKYTTNYTIEDVKAMWLEGGCAVLTVVEKQFANCFEDTYKSRWSDFVINTVMWNRAAKEFSKAVARPKDWKARLTQTLVK
tara:strand:- start:77 stop:1378 length:1302 start_codon:yes stop_codon:yes gene_type:complete